MSKPTYSRHGTVSTVTYPKDVVITRPGMTEVCKTIEELVARDNSDGMQAVFDALWDLTTIRETAFEDVDAACREMLVAVIAFRHYLDGGVTADELLAK